MFGEINMNIPTRQDVNEMERLSRIISGDFSIPISDVNTTNDSNNLGPIVLSKTPTKNDVNIMTKIMENYSSVTGVTSFKSFQTTIDKAITSVVKDSHTDAALREALNTEKIKTGIIIGAWAIEKKTQRGITEKLETVYRIRNKNTHQQIGASFLIVESAKCVVKLLNQGVSLDSPKIKEIAILELEYRKFRQKALEEKRSWQKAKKSNNEFKQDLYEAKFDAAKSKALCVREKIDKMYYQL